MVEGWLSCLCRSLNEGRGPVNMARGVCFVNYITQLSFGADFFILNTHGEGNCLRCCNNEDVYFEQVRFF